MSGRFVRASKYRHVFGQSTRKEQCYDNLRISKNAWDSNIIKANPQYLSVNWEASGGGAFAVIPVNERGKLPERLPLFRGHTAAVLDTDWSPFDDTFLASGSDDGKVFLWKVPEGFTLYTDAEDPQDVSPVSKLTGHSRKVGHVLFHPAAQNVLASSSGDFTIKLWDVEAGSPRLTLKHNDIVQSMSWNASGSLLVTTSRDKKLRLWDVRQEKPVYEGPGHAGAKNSRAVWMGDHDRIATTGFSRMSDRQLGLWDIKNPKEPVGGFQILDSISGVAMPFWDDGTQCLYVAGKGDGNIRYFEYEHDKFEYLSEYKSGDPQRGIAFLPKRGVNTHENEVMRAYKTVNDSYIEPISFIVPRRAEVFQGDIYPPAVGTKPAMSAQEWFDGKDGLPPKIDLASLYAGETPVELPSDFKPTTIAPQENKAPETKKEPEQPKPTVSVAASRGPPPSMKEQKGSIADMAAKFADKAEDEEEEDDASSFEEIPKPHERHAIDRMEQKTVGGPKVVNATPAPIEKSTKAADSSPAVTSRMENKTSGPSIAETPKASSSMPTRPTRSASGLWESTTPPKSDSSSIQSELHDIKSLLQQQNKAMSEQNEKIVRLTAEVDTLKTRLSESKTSMEKDERIRQLELELEQAKS